MIIDSIPMAWLEICFWLRIFFSHLGERPEKPQGHGITIFKNIEHSYFWCVFSRQLQNTKSVGETYSDKHITSNNRKHDVEAGMQKLFYPMLRKMKVLFIGKSGQQ